MSVLVGIFPFSVTSHVTYFVMRKRHNQCEEIHEEIIRNLFLHLIHIIQFDLK